MSYRFASQVTDTVTLSDGNAVVIRKLGHRAQEAAIEERQHRAQRRLASLGTSFVEFQQALQKTLTANEENADAVKKAQADPWQKYDKDTVLERGIVSWTLSEKPTAEEIAELDPADADAIANRLYDLFRPKTEEETKNS